MIRGFKQTEYSSGQEDAEVGRQFHELNILFAHAILEHMPFIEDAHLPLKTS
jgi:hypothetical protein